MPSSVMTNPPTVLESLNVTANLNLRSTDKALQIYRGAISHVRILMSVKQLLFPAS